MEDDNNSNILTYGYCPVCGYSDFDDAAELELHIEMHFSSSSLNVTSSPSTSTRFGAHGAEALDYIPVDHENPATGYGRQETENEDVWKDHQLALNLQQLEMNEQSVDRREFPQNRHRVNNHNRQSRQSNTNRQRGFHGGERNVRNYTNRRFDSSTDGRDDVDDSYFCTEGLLPMIRALSIASPKVNHTWVCSDVTHFGATPSFKGWGCGYRNLQMMLSSLFHNSECRNKLFNEGLFAVPSVPELQELIETAWRNGFDLAGSSQLDGKLVDTRKWIGATEVAAVLSFLHIKICLVDCFWPTGDDGTHPEMLQWVKNYFTDGKKFKFPIYLQHDGHSRTVVGIEQLRNDSLQLLIFDPGHKKKLLEQFNSYYTRDNAMNLVRRSSASLRKKQYQLVAVDGLIETEREYQESKLLKSICISPLVDVL